MANKNIIPSARDLADAGSSSNGNVNPNQNNNHNNNNSDHGVVNVLSPERIHELQIHRFMHKVVAQAPIAEHFVKALLPIVNLVHFCIVFDYAFDWLRARDDLVKELCTSFDFMAIYKHMPSLNLMQQIMKRFKPKKVKFGHNNHIALFSMDVLMAFDPLKYRLETLNLNIANPLQTLNMHKISVNELIIKSNSFFPNIGASAYIGVLRSINMNVRSITLKSCPIDDFVTERFRDFIELKKLRLLECETYLVSFPEAFFRQLSRFKKLIILHIRCIQSYHVTHLNTWNRILMDNIHHLQQLEDLEITIGTIHTSIDQLQSLHKLKRLRINIEVRSILFELGELLTTIRRHFGNYDQIEIHIFSTVSSVQAKAAQTAAERQVQDMRIPNIKISHSSPYEYTFDDD